MARGGNLKLKLDRRGFVLSGTAILLILPAMLLAASCLKIVETGGEAVSLQATADKVYYTGNDIERMIRHMENNKMPRDNEALEALAENYRVSTGLIVEITAIGEALPSISVMVRDPRGIARYASIVYP